MTAHALRADAEASSLAAKGGPIVVKLGGSVVRSPDLASWLDAIAAAPAPTVIVPGGGALADEVRDCQVKLGFGDAAAHRMALLAMDQLAWAVAGLRGGFQVGATEDELLNALEHGLVAVWAPYALIAERTDIEEQLADHLRQPRALACAKAPRAALLPDQVNRAHQAEPRER